jgi:predicted outer membrane repeat protein
VTITNPGTGYTSPPTISFSGGGGTGAAATAILASPHITVTMQGFTITNGVALGDGPAGTGGGIRDTNNASLVLTNMVLTHNFAATDGGGVSMEDVLNTPWALVLNNTTVSFNRAGDQGGGIEEDGTGRVLINPGSVITHNVSAFEGAGVYLDAVAEGGVASVAVTQGGSGFQSAPTVTFSGGGGTGATGTAVIANGRVVAVTITNPGTGYIAAPTVTFSGGGTGAAAIANLTLGTSNLTVTGAVITNNVSLFSIGGGIGNSGNAIVTIASSTVANNFAGETGGGFSDENNVGTLIVTNSLFRNNVARGDGGAIFVGSPSTTITSSEITGNISGGEGGGIFAGGTTLTVLNSTVAHNIAGGNGGGIELETSGSGPASGSSITSSTITGNIAVNDHGPAAGGGIDASAAFTGSLLLLNDTINGNAAGTGGGVAAAGTAGSSVTVQNTIIAGNFAGHGHEGEEDDDGFGDHSSRGADAAGTFLDNGGNLIGISGSGSGNTGFSSATTQTGTTAHPLDPLLGPLQNNGGPTVGASGSSITLETEALLPGSKAIDRGVAGAPAVDERGFPRADAAATTPPDIGAFEFENVTLGVTVAPSSPTVTVGGSLTLTVTVTNTSANALPSDNTLVTILLPPNLTLTSSPPGATVTGNTVTVALGPLAAGGSTQLTLGVTASSAGQAKVAVSVTSPDANPNKTSGSTTVSVM